MTMSEMHEQVIAGFRTEFRREPQVVTRAPGRLEILGNHTDYNEGVVLSVAVDRATYVAAAACPGKDCRIKDLRDGSEREFRTDQLSHPRPRDWANYVKGLVVELQRRKVQVPGFQAVLLSSVPLSAGMSSSAALEISMCYALSRLANTVLPWQEWAKIGQASENNYVGAKTGLLDQFSSIRGRKGHLVFSDFRSLEVTNVPLPPGTALVVANSMVKHHLTNEYNERRQCCEQAVAFLQTKFAGVRALRDVTRAQLEACAPEMDPLAFRRALHVVGENERVFAGIKALEANDLTTFGQLMFESQASSRENFENSAPELDILVEEGRRLPGLIGARLSGGGFGGITVHLVESSRAEQYSHDLAAAYRQRTRLDAQVMTCSAADGAEILLGAKR